MPLAIVEAKFAVIVPEPPIEAEVDAEVELVIVIGPVVLQDKNV